MRTRVAIIGAGPAGSAAAYHLANVGLDVTLIESKAFPRQKVCGEYISPAARGLLEELIEPEELVRAGARQVPRIGIEVGEHHAAWLAPAPAWSISREKLDAMLLEKAAGAGASVLQPASVRDVHYTQREATVHLADGRTLAVDLVVHADGHGRHDPAGPVPLDPSVIAHKCHLRIPGADPHAVTMRSCAKAYVGTIAIEDGLFTCALVATRDLTHCYNGDADALLASRWPEYKAGWRVSDWVACGVPRTRYLSPGHPRSVRIGNAAAAVDPVGGEGIGLALWAAHQLSELAAGLGPLRTETEPVQLKRLIKMERRFATRYRARLRTRLPACQLAAWMLMRPRLVRALWPTSAFPIISFRPWYRLTGKPGAEPAASP